MKPIPHLKTFSNAFEIRETNNHPILAICSDLNTYVIKHSQGKTPCHRLATEFVASCFLKLWNIHTPDIAIIDVQKEHLREVMNPFCQPAFFKVPCFGSQYYSYGIEFNKFMGEIKSYEKSKFHNLNDFLKVALFDIWMANEDRSVNNPNLLVLPLDTGYEVCAIDHEHCFNSGNLDKGLYSITSNDSILGEPAVRHILGHKVMSDRDNLNQIADNAYICIDSCKENTDEILSYIPSLWQTDISSFKRQLTDFLFSPEWLKQAIRTFFEILHTVNQL